MVLKGKILISAGRGSFPEDVAETLRPLADPYYVSRGGDEYDDVLRGAVAVIVSTEPIDEEYLGKSPRLKIVARHGVGYDSVDVDVCTRRGVYVTHTPGVLSAAVADMTWALILSLVRKIPAADRFVRKEWASGLGKNLFGQELEGKTLGIIGLGRIGAEVAKRTGGFGVKLIYYDVVRRSDVEQTCGAEFVGFEALLRRSDIISLHVPLLPSTRRLIGKRELELMKSTAVLINTSRGPIIDQEALCNALESGRIGGAGLDVFEEEPIPLDDHLLKLENVVLTPHIATATVETRRKMAVVCAGNVRAVLEGKRPPNLVPEQKDATF